MNINKRNIIGIVVMPLILIILLGSMFVKNYFNSSYDTIMSSVYIKDGQSLLVAVKPTDSTSQKIKFFELNAETNEVVNSFSIKTTASNVLNLKYDDNGALITIINDDSQNTALSVYNVYKYESGKQPQLISSDMQSDTSLKNLFDWRDGIAILDKDTNGDEAAIYIKNGIVEKQLITNREIINNIKRFANETVVQKTDEVPYAELNLYNGKSAFIGMFLNSQGKFPVVIGEKSASIKQLGSELYTDKNLIKLFASGSGYRAGLYSYGNESAKTLLEPTTAIYNAVAYYPNMNTTIVLGTAEAKISSARVGYVYDNKTGKITHNLTEALKNAAGLETAAGDNVYLTANSLCIVANNKFYLINITTGKAYTNTNAIVLQSINKYDRYQFSTLYDYATSQEGSTLLYNVAIWFFFPFLSLAFIGMGRRQKNEQAKRSKLLTGTIVSIDPSKMRLYGMVLSEFEVEVFVGGVLKKLRIRATIPPGQIMTIGQSVVISYDQLTGKALLADEKMVNAALGKPVVQEAIIEKIESLDIYESDAELVRLYISFLQGKNEVRVIVPGIQTSIMPFAQGEKVSIRYMSNSPEDTTILVGRGKNISEARESYSGQAEIIFARSIGPEIEGRYIVLIDTICKAKVGSVAFDNILLTKDISVLHPGVKILFSADKEIFEKRLKLQNMSQDTAIVKEIEATGEAIGYSPMLLITLNLINADGEEVILTINENISPFNIPKVGDRVLVGYDIESREATLIKKV